MIERNGNENLSNITFTKISIVEGMSDTNRVANRTCLGIPRHVVSDATYLEVIRTVRGSSVVFDCEKVLL